MEYYDSAGEAHSIDDEYDYNDDYKLENFYDNSKNVMIKAILKEGPELQHLSEFPSNLGRYIAIDAEFTGLDEKEDQLLELAACEIYDCKITENKFHCYIKPRKEIKNSEFHGITNKTYENLPKNMIIDDKKNLENFLKFVGDSLIVGHNPLKDIHFINKELKNCNLKKIDPKKFRCTMRMYFNKYKKNYIKKINLIACCEAFHIDCKNKHTAVNDCENIGKLFIRLIKKKKNKGKKK